MNLSKKTRAIAETAIETVLGLAAGTPLALATTGTSQTVGTGAVVLAVAMFATNLVQVPVVERFLDRVLGKGREAQLVSLAQELQDVEQVMAEHVAQHEGQGSSAPSSGASAAVVQSAPASAEAPASATPASTADGTPPAGPAGS